MKKLLFIAIFFLFGHAGLLVAETKEEKLFALLENYQEANQDDIQEKIKELLKQKVNPNIKNNEGETPLHIACKKANSSIIRNLIAGKADVTIADNNGWTPIMLASLRENLLKDKKLETIIIPWYNLFELLGNKRNINHQTSRPVTIKLNNKNYLIPAGSTLLMIGIITGIKDEYGMLFWQWLLSLNCNYRTDIDLSLENAKHDTALSLAENLSYSKDEIAIIKSALEDKKKFEELLEAIEQQNSTLVRDLIDEYDSDNIPLLSRTNKNKESALFIASKIGNEDIFNLILTHIKKYMLWEIVDKVNLQGITPFMIATAYGHTSIMKKLLNKVNFNIRTTDQFTIKLPNRIITIPKDSTALMIAAYTDQLAAAEILINRGVGIYYKNAQNQSALDIAKKSNNKKFIILILQEDFWNASDQEDIQEMKQLVAEGVNVNAHNYLAHAMTSRKEKAVDFLLTHQADVNIPDGPWTPLMIASFNGDVPTAKKLIAYSANLNAQSLKDTTENDVLYPKDSTALIIATLAGQADVAQELMSAGADTKITNREGKTAQDYAKETKNQILIDLLSNKAPITKSVATGTSNTLRQSLMLLQQRLSALKKVL